MTAQQIHQASAPHAETHKTIGATPAASPRNNAAYVLGPEDAVRISVLEAEEISAEPIRIGNSGDINVPLVGRFRAAGLTVEQLEAKLADRLRVYLHQPKVAVSVAEYRSQPVSVIGRVTRPGVHQLAGQKTLVEMLSVAGGIAADAGHRIRITRRLEWGDIPLPAAEVDPTGRFSVAEVNLRSVLEGKHPEQNIIIQPHDVVSVPRARMVYVIGAVGQSGGYVLEEQETLSVLQALALARGLSSKAAPAKARILRSPEDGGERVEITVNLKEVMSNRSPDIPLREDDILFVPKSGGKVVLSTAAEAAIRVGTGILIWRR